MKREVAVVTGCNGLTGQAICKVLAAKGYDVVGLDVAEKAVADVAYERCDVTKHDQIVAVMERVQQSHGVVKVLVNNAGVWHGKTFFDITPQDYDFTYGVNARGPFFLAQEFARRLMAAGGVGAIVNLASIVGVTGSGVTDYGGSKAAVINLTKSLAKPLGVHGIRVNAVSPGTINTAMGEKVPKEIRDKLIANSGLRRAAEPEEIANVVGFLVSPDSSYMTGAIVDVNGGL
ncbi:MAG TPA: SDR family oxidoreductase [Ramlibacter sp.]|nr:SDR family oxidoreductase [Ramlibacter sp.]